LADKQRKHGNPGPKDHSVSSLHLHVAKRTQSPGDADGVGEIFVHFEFEPAGTSLRGILDATGYEATTEGQAPDDRTTAGEPTHPHEQRGAFGAIGTKTALQLARTRRDFDAELPQTWGLAHSTVL
jgi:hypothetical protein